MPIYEYQCADCCHSMEAIQKMSDPVLVDCPACGKAALKKCVSAPSFRLAGGGWYETDFKTGSKKQLAEADSAGAKETKPAESDKGAAANTSVATSKTDAGKTGASDESAKKPAAKASKAKATTPGKS